MTPLRHLAYILMRSDYASRDSMPLSAIAFHSDFAADYVLPREVTNVTPPLPDIHFWPPLAILRHATPFDV